MSRKWAPVFFIAGIGFLLRGVEGEYLMLPFVLAGAFLLGIGVVSIFRKPEPKMTDYEKMSDDIQNNRPIKL